jgi:cell cycle checkpoint protein
MSQESSSPSTPRRSGATSRRRKQPRPSLKPPQRLSWPASLSSQEESHKADHFFNNKKNASAPDGPKTGTKRARFSEPYGRNKTIENAIWVEKYTPKFSADLCIAPKKVKEIKAWIQESLERNTPNRHSPKKQLLVLVGSPGIGKSTCIRVLAKEMKLGVQSWNESFQPRSQGTHPNDIFAVEQSSALDSFHEFLKSSGAGFSSLDVGSILFDDKPSNYSETEKSLILLEELPNLHGPEAEMKFRNIMSSHLRRSLAPTILVFSDVSEGKHRPEDLERIVDPDDLYDNDRTTILQIHAVTKPKMKKVLMAIGKHENFPVDSNFVEELHSQSCGDLRHAIMTLQVHASGSSTKTTPSMASLRHGHSERDTKLSTFHSLGKMLYAKRTFENGQSRLAFDPDKILERSDMGLEGSLRFLEFHSLDFFTDISDISKAYQYYSDAVELLDTATSMTLGNNWERRHDMSSAYPYGCAAAIAGRAVANTNDNPAPNKFRQFSRPKVFDVLANRKQNQVMVEQLSKRLSTYRNLASPSGEVVVGGCGDTGAFVTEMLPFVRRILPQEVDPVVNNLYSVAVRSRHQFQKTLVKDEEEAGFLKQQEEILGKDDIDDFDSDS